MKTNEEIDTEDDQLNLHRLIDLNILKINDLIREVQEKAENQYNIEKVLQKIIIKWNIEELQFDCIKNTNQYIIKSSFVEKITEYLEDHLV
jgi:hypothetical protein